MTATHSAGRPNPTDGFKAPQSHRWLGSLKAVQDPESFPRNASRGTDCPPTRIETSKMQGKGMVPFLEACRNMACKLQLLSMTGAWAKMLIVTLTLRAGAAQLAQAYLRQTPAIPAHFRDGGGGGWGCPDSIYLQSCPPWSHKCNSSAGSPSFPDHPNVSSGRVWPSLLTHGLPISSTRPPHRSSPSIPA